MTLIFSIVVSLTIASIIVYISLKNDSDYGDNFSLKFDGIMIFVIFVVAGLSWLNYKYVSYEFSRYLLSVVFLTYVALVSYIDLKIFLIYDLHVVLFSVILFIADGYIVGYNLKNSVLGFIVGAVFYGLIYFLSKVYYKKEAFGLGDVYVLSGLGLILGPLKTVVTGFLAFYFAAIVIIVKLPFVRKNIAKQELAFGPYVLMAGYVLYWFFEYFVKLYNAII